MELSGVVCQGGALRGRQWRSCPISHVEERSAGILRDWGEGGRRASTGREPQLSTELWGGPAPEDLQAQVQVQAGGSEVQGHPRLAVKFEASLGGFGPRFKSRAAPRRARSFFSTSLKMLGPVSCGSAAACMHLDRAARLEHTKARGR